MTPEEVGWRIGDRVHQEVWARRRSAPVPDAEGPANRATPTVPAGIDLRAMDPRAREDLRRAADELLGGRATILGVLRTDMDAPTWARDPTTGLAFPRDRCAFRIDYRSGTAGPNVKQVWELSRLHHLTVLASAWRLSGDDRYAAMVARHLRSWRAQNPVLCGVNWTSGIEVGIRLISWAWVRRLLDGWPGIASVFEDDADAVRQLYWHQRYLATFRSRGSSANNHVIAEAAGQLVASCAFPWFAESARWRADSSALLERELERNTFPDGVNREQAFDYHGLVAELGLVAAAEARAVGVPLGPATLQRLCRMVDVVAAVLDRSGRPPRYGDGDDGRALVVTAPHADRWSSLLALGAAVFGPMAWWPSTVPDAQSILVGGLLGRVTATGRSAERPSHFPSAGLTILRSAPGGQEELWCRCDGGPHGFLSIAAHGHADALSIEVRHRGVELLSDPGTYCYHGDPEWRDYFRSTLGHNTVELDGEDQSVPGGPFLWTGQARTTVLALQAGETGRQRWSAEHDGYERLADPARHLRTVELDRDGRSLVVTDRVRSRGPHDVRLAFHLGPTVVATVEGHEAELVWQGADGTRWSASMLLPESMAWTSHRAGTGPILGWYSSRFGTREPTTTLVGTARVAAAVLRTELRVRPAGLSGGQ